MTSAAAISAPVASTKSSTERQLELTLNAIARSMRKAIRLAEKEDPTGTSSRLWKAVEHRAGMLETMLKAAADYAQALAAKVAKPTATQGVTAAQVESAQEKPVLEENPTTAVPTQSAPVLPENGHVPNGKAAAGPRRTYFMQTQDGWAWV